MAKSFLENMNRPVAAILPAAHPEIEIMQRRLLALYEEQRAYLASKPRAYVEELLHRAEDDRANATFTRRTAAEINHAACVLILEERCSVEPAARNSAHSADSTAKGAKR